MSLIQFIVLRLFLVFCVSSILKRWATLGFYINDNDNGYFIHPFGQIPLRNLGITAAGEQLD